MSLRRAVSPIASLASVLMLTLVLSGGALASVEVALDEFEDTTGRYTIDGKVYSPELFAPNSNWQKDTVVTINDGEYNGFLREDGTFVISNVPSGSYVVDIVNPDYLYESVSRLDTQNRKEFLLSICLYCFSIASRSIQRENSVRVV